MTDKSAKISKPTIKDPDIFTPLAAELALHARAISLPDGSAELFIKETLKNVKKSLKNKHTITEQDLRRAVVKELQKYHADFAYVFEFCDIIV
ncbi:hypothetical protein IJ135_01800 [Candidatus Saccharibacteria bacterium]|nr:hypothetical protein [Candidatus Saccharibacteria bacterium]